MRAQPMIPSPRRASAPLRRLDRSRHVSRPLTRLALCAATLCALSACKSTPATPDVLTLPQPTVAAPIKDLIVDPNPGFLVRGRLGAWSELAPTLDALAHRAPDDRLGDLLEVLGADGPLAAFEAAVEDEPLPDEFPDLTLIDRSKDAFVHVSVVASDQTWGLLDLGVGLLSPYEPLKFWNVVALVPSSDPERLAAQFNIGELQAEPAGAYVRIWYSEAIYGLAEAPGEPETGSFVQELRPWRMTPALARFLEGGAPASMYVRADDTRLLASAQGITQMMSALRFVSAEDKQKLVARGMAIALNTLALAPRAVTEFEDHVVSLGGDAEAKAAFVDAVSTRTAFGRSVQAAGASAGPVPLPSFVDAAFPPERRVLDASYNFDASRVDDLYAPALRAIYGEEPRADMRQRDLRELAYSLREVGPFGLLSTLATSPTYTAALLSLRAPDRFIGAARPLAARVRVIQAQGAVPLAAAAAVAFSGDTSTLEVRLADLQTQLPPNLAEMLSITFTPGESAGGLLTVSFNLEGEVFGPEAPVAPGQGGFTFDATPLGVLSPEARALGEFGELGVQALAGANTSTVRLSLAQAPVAAKPAPAYVFDATSNPDACVDRIARTVIQTFSAMATVVPDERVRLFSIYLQEVDACAEKVDSPHWDIARARGETFPLTFSGDYDANLAAHTKACEKGDEAGCAGKAYLERVGPPKPPMAPESQPGDVTF
jgi:hypothetical protein